jgi:uncharacterized protein YjiS (DUF1127 family)
LLVLLSETWEFNMKLVLSLTTTGRRYGSVSQKTRRAAEWFRLSKAVFGRVVAVLGEWRQRSRERAQLALLDERMLRDIGVSRGEVLREVNKPFWRA